MIEFSCRSPDLNRNQYLRQDLKIAESGLKAWKLLPRKMGKNMRNQTSKAESDRSKKSCNSKRWLSQVLTQGVYHYFYIELLHLAPYCAVPVRSVSVPGCNSTNRGNVQVGQILMQNSVQEKCFTMDAVAGYVSKCVIYNECECVCVCGFIRTTEFLSVVITSWAGDSVRSCSELKALWEM